MLAAMLQHFLCYCMGEYCILFAAKGVVVQCIYIVYIIYILLGNNLPTSHVIRCLLPSLTGVTLADSTGQYKAMCLLSMV